MSPETQPPSPGPGRGPAGGSRPGLSTAQKQILVVLLVPLFMSLLSVSIVNVVLPAIGTSLQASASALQWVLAGYTLAFGVLLVPAGRAGDLFGRGQLFVIGVALFGLASLLAGFAPDDVVLNLARILMGFGSGLLNPQTVGLIQQYFHGEQRGRAFGMFGLVVGVSVAIGPVLGGGFVELFGADWGWRSSFLVNVPIAAIGVLAAIKQLPASAWRPLPGAAGEHPPSPLSSSVPTHTGEMPAVDAAHGNGAAPTSTQRHRDLDPMGVLLLGAATLLVILPFLQAAQMPLLWAMLPVGLMLAGAWIWWEARYKRQGRQPMVDLALFRDGGFSTGMLVISVYFAGMPAVWVVTALYLQSGLGFTALQTGLIGLPSAVLSAISSVIAGRLTWRMGRKLVLIGLICVQLGLVGTAGVIALVEMAGWNPWWLLVPLGVLGLGGGAVVSPNQTFALKDVPLTHAGSAGGVLQTGQRIGTAVGLSAITGVYFLAQAMGGSGTAALAGVTAIILVVGLSGTLSVYDIMRARAAGEAR